MILGAFGNKIHPLRHGVLQRDEYYAASETSSEAKVAARQLYCKMTSATFFILLHFAAGIFLPRCWQPVRRKPLTGVGQAKGRERRSSQPVRLASKSACEG